MNKTYIYIYIKILLWVAQKHPRHDGLLRKMTTNYKGDTRPRVRLLDGTKICTTLTGQLVVRNVHNF